MGSAQQSVNLGGIGPGGGETQTLSISAVSDNPALIPNPSVSYTSPNTTGTLSFTPNPTAFGGAVIIVTVTDSGDTSNGGNNTTTRSFTQVVGVLDRIFANGFQLPQVREKPAKRTMLRGPCWSCTVPRDCRWRLSPCAREAKASTGR